MILRTLILCGLIFIDAVGCVSNPTLEHLEDEALATGDWTAVDRREELIKERRELTGPGCEVGLTKTCVEEPSGIECYCKPSAQSKQDHL